MPARTDILSNSPIRIRRFSMAKTEKKPQLCKLPTQSAYISYAKPL